MKNKPEMIVNKDTIKTTQDKLSANGFLFLVLSLFSFFIDFNWFALLSAGLACYLCVWFLSGEYKKYATITKIKK